MSAVAAGRLSVEKKILAGFGLALLILVVTCGVSYRTTIGLVQTVTWVGQAHRILEKLADLRAQMVDVESGARGYVITGKEEYLAPYYSGVEKARQTFDELQNIIVDPNQRQRLEGLRPLVVERVSAAAKDVDTRRSQGFVAAEALVETDDGKRVMDRIRVVIREIEVAERDLLAQRYDSAQASARNTVVTVVAGTLVGLTIVILAGLFIRRDMSERRRAEQALRESQELLQDFLDNANDLIHSVAPDGRFLYVNRKWRETMGYGEDELKQLAMQDIVHPEHRLRAESVRFQALAGSVVDDFETVFVTKGGQSIKVSGHINPRFEDGKAVAMRSIFRDITESKKAAEELQRSNEVLLRSVTELEQRSREIANLGEMGDLLQSCQSVEEAYRVVARSVPQILTAESGALGITSASRNLVEIAANWGTDDPGERVFIPDDCWALRRGRMNVVEDPDSALHCRHLGEVKRAGYLCVPLVAQGEALGLLHLRAGAQGDEHRMRLTPARQRLVGTVADRIALALANLRLREAMRQQSVRDPLTGLFNRRYMEESLERELRRAARNGRPLGVLMLDLDYFKRFNDSFGHDAGDTMLREFSNVLGSSIRGGDIACRYGGEEFALILPEASLRVTVQRAEVLREKARHLSVEHRGLSLGIITVSIGVAAFPEHGASSESLLRSADAALYSAKAGGRDRVVVAPMLDLHTAPTPGT